MASQANTVSSDILSAIRHALLDSDSRLSYASMQVSEHSNNADLSSVPNSQPTSAIEHSPTAVTRASSSARRAALLHTTASNLAAKHGPPRLSLIKTAPAASLSGMVEETPSQVRSKMYNSFSVIEDINGDTQPIESQLFQDYAKSHVSEIAPFIEPDEVNYAEEDESDGGPLYNEDEALSQEADLPTSWDDVNGVHVSSYELTAGELSPQAESRIQHSMSQGSPPSSSPKFVVPKTPAIAGHKRNYDGDLLLTSATKTTPGSAFGNAFGKSKTGVSLTQMFDATQAETPTANDLKSDPIFLRPSPNFGEARSSPMQWPASSPVKKFGSVSARATTEPRDSYLAMKESQELRERRRRREEELERLRSDADMESDDMLSREERLAQRRRQRTELNKQALQEASLTAPQRQTSSHRKTRSLISSEAHYVTPGRSLKRQATRQVIEISDGDDSSVSSEDELADDLPTSSFHSQSEEQVQRSVQVPMTSSRPKISSGKQLESSPPTTPPLDRNNNETPSKLSQKASQTLRRRTVSGSQTVAVADSQPTRSQQDGLRKPARLIDESSLGSRSRIGQSQPSLTSSQADQAADRLKTKSSSFPKPPPLDSSQHVANTLGRVPSSPPILNTEISVETQDLVVRDPILKLDINGKYVDNVDQVLTKSPVADDVDDVDPLANNIPTEKESSPVRPRRRASQPMRVNVRDDAVDEAQLLKGIHQDPTTPTEATMDSHSNLVSSRPNGEAGTNSHTTGQYQTAHSHLTGSPNRKSTGSQRHSQPSYLSQKTPQISQKTPQLTPLRSMKDIAADKSPGKVDTQDMDFDDLISADTRAFIELTSASSPKRPTKRRRVVYGKKGNAWGLPSPRKANLESLVRSKSPPRDGSEDVDTNQSDQLTVEEDEEMFSLPALPKKTAVLVSHGPGRLPTMNRPVVTDLGSGSAARRGKKRRPPSIAETPQSKTATVSDGADALPQTDEVSVFIQTEHAKPNAHSEPHRSTSPGENADDNEPELNIDDDNTLTPNRVFARFNGGPGGNMSYWPATCIGSEGKRYKIRFDDGTQDLVEGMHVRSLDLRHGDVVKVDVTGMRQKTYVVLGLNGRITSAQATDLKSFPLTDRCGYEKVVLEVKARDSISDNKKTKRHIVALTNVYLTSTMWPRFKERLFNPVSAATSGTTTDPRPGTPVSASISAISPQSRSRRPARNYQELTTSDALHLAPTPEPTYDGIFAEMGFGITFASGAHKEHRDTDRETLERLILSQGGRIIGPDMASMFNVPDSPTPGSVPFILEHRYASLKFVAVLANTHGHRAKYIQALALGIPCLSARWAHDCVRHARILPIGAYLLPAGHSRLLGTIRSRTLPAPICYDPTAPEAYLSSVLARRDMLLDQKTVLLITGKASAERLGAYRFLSLALGAVSVASVSDISEARKKLRGVDSDVSAPRDGPKHFDWIFADEHMVDNAVMALLDEPDTRLSLARTGASKGTSRKQKLMADTTGVPELRRGKLAGKVVRVASDEFLKQSLILGALLEE
ncbi:hypothetical protein EJ05DRAFT_513686 [Pseudovirgaria hyperparasitica]|uniref:BRCT domain-containing protein n=1 Tax=Pseudovirgaria hyperparasitica TaxID=470096 RepID=A0A6A6VY59_9PEZI|nr:uncharacterized protein EJ05DRAFT_513686 [Pseudovirgaria hyperparasitica]KAF2754756.1 hypothetical protein EJ05DRAFT_513686 [Pseudovirgaria hyperparasitica]